MERRDWAIFQKKNLRGYNGMSYSIVKSFDCSYPTIMPHNEHLEIHINIRSALVLYRDILILFQS